MEFILIFLALVLLISVVAAVSALVSVAGAATIIVEEDSEDE